MGGGHVIATSLLITYIMNALFVREFELFAIQAIGDENYDSLEMWPISSQGITAVTLESRASRVSRPK
jgi:hypothetical protein